MGVQDSPLRGRVLFIEGSPRSGTSWLITLVATHPDIAGLASESRIFARGVGSLFENHENPSWGVNLSAYVSRDALADLVRDLCDGVLLRMRGSVKPDARFVVEKSPLLDPDPHLLMQRKLRCYPDAWYLHLVRDEEAVMRSLMRAPFMEGRQEAAVRETLRESVAAIRDVLGEQPRFRELTYEDLRACPEDALADIFRWIGVTVDDAVLERVRTLSEERFATHDPPRSLPRPRRRTRERLRQAKRTLLNGHGGSSQPQPSAAARLIEALKGSGGTCVEDLTAESFSLELRTGEGDFRADGEKALEALHRVGEALFTRKFVSVAWSPAEAESAFAFQAVDGESRRVDVALQAVERDGRVVRLTVISAGSLEGRPMLRLPVAGS